MAGDEAKQKPPRTRSPAYPYLSLPEALERTAQLRRAEGRHAVSVSVAMQHWGYKAESSTGYSCIAALKKYGLVDEEGVGENREVRLSALALSLLLDATDPDSTDRAAALRTAALNPRIHAELWERYGPELPSDQTLRRFLLLEKNFNEASVDEFVAEYRSTVAYAGLSEPVATGVGPLPASPPAAAVTFPRPIPPRRTAGPSSDDPAAPPGLLGAELEELPTAPPSAPPRREQPRPASAPPPAGEDDGPVPAQATPVPPAPFLQQPPVPASPTPVPPGGGSRELPVPLDHDLVARIPYPMSEESYALLMDTLQLWKKRLVRKTPE